MISSNSSSSTDMMVAPDGDHEARGRLVNNLCANRVVREARRDVDDVGLVRVQATTHDEDGHPLQQISNGVHFKSPR